jgi:hypothetical protein
MILFRSIMRILIALCLLPVILHLVSFLAALSCDAQAWTSPCILGYSRDEIIRGPVRIGFELSVWTGPLAAILIVIWVVREIDQRVM